LRDWKGKELRISPGGIGAKEIRFDVKSVEIGNGFDVGMIKTGDWGSDGYCVYLYVTYFQNEE